MKKISLLLLLFAAAVSAFAQDDVMYVHYINVGQGNACLLYTSPSPRDRTRSRMPSSA